MLEELEICKTCSGGIEFCRANFVEHCDSAKESQKGKERDIIQKPECPECGEEMQKFGWTQWYCNYCAQFYKETKLGEGSPSI